jgi:anti-anti-sigma factor
MQIKETQQNDLLIMSLTGRLDSTTSPDFEKQILSRLGEHSHLVLDFSDLDYISSAGLRVLLLAAKKIKQASGSLILCALKEHLREVFEISGFLTILDVRPSLADALTGAAG